MIDERVDLGPDSEQLARVWGHGIVGMMHAAGRLVAGRTALLPRRAGAQPGRPAVGPAGRGGRPVGGPGF